MARLHIDVWHSLPIGNLYFANLLNDIVVEIEKTKLILIVFIDYRVVVHREFVPQDLKVNTKYHFAILSRLRVLAQIT